MLPAAKIPYSRPFTPGEPISSANAVSETCIPPKTEPIPRRATARTRTPGTDKADVRGSSEAPAPCRPVRGCVARWAAKSSPPTSVSAASAISPAAGWMPVQSAVASTGPMTKVNSSVTDSKAAAVGSSDGAPPASDLAPAPDLAPGPDLEWDPSPEPARAPAPEPWRPSTAAQRERTMGPICGMEAPVGTAATNSAQRGASARASAISTATDAACTSTPGTSTAR